MSVLEVNAPRPLPDDTGPDAARGAYASPRPRPGGRLLPHLPSALTYGVLALVAMFPLWPGDPSRIEACACGGNKDPVQTAWFLAWLPYALLHGHDPFTTAAINAPYGANLAQNTGIPLLGLLAAPLTLAVSPVASENLLRWLAFTCSALAMYAVCWKWLQHRGAAFAAGLCYGFSPYMVGQASAHLDLTFVPLPPLIFSVLYELVVARRPRAPGSGVPGSEAPGPGALRSGVLLGLLAAAQFYVSAEILMTTGLAAAVALLLLACTHPRAALARTGHVATGLLIAAGVLAACTGYPLWLMTHGPQRYMGPSVGVHEVYNADLLGALVPTTMQLVAPHRLAAIGSAFVGGAANVDENGSYLGVPLLLVAAWIAVRHRRQRWISCCCAVAVVMWACSLGPHLDIDHHRVRLPFPLPFALLRHLPFFPDVLPARLSLYVTLFLAFVLALGIAARHETAVAWRGASGEYDRRRGRRLGTAAACLVGLAVVVSLLPRWPYRSVPATPAPAEQPAALAAIPSGTTVLTYPYLTPSNDIAMLWQALDRFRFDLVGSYVLRRGPSGSATQLPSALPPYDVEGMLADALAPDAVPIPKVPYLAPTLATVHATRVVIGTRSVKTLSSNDTSAGTGRRRPSLGYPSLGHPVPGYPALVGTVASTNPRTRSFYVIGPNHDLVGVLARRSTRYVPATRSAAPFRSIHRGDRVAVYGVTTRGTLGKRRVANLRTWLGAHHIGAVLVQLGRTDAAVVVDWVTAAIGPPTHEGGGGALWTSVQSRLAASVHVRLAASVHVRLAASVHVRLAARGHSRLRAGGAG